MAKENYVPNKEILDKYADLLVRFALNSGKGINKGETVFIQVPECAKPMLVSLRRAVLKAGGNPLIQFIPDDISREYYELANEEQLGFFPGKLLKGRVDEIDHSISIIADSDLHELEGIDPKKIMVGQKAFKPYMEWRDEKENQGKFTWTLALYATPAMAKEAGLSLEDYWNEIIKACYLDVADPIKKWKEITDEVGRVMTKLDSMKIEKLRVIAKDTDLVVGLGKGRKWMGGSGRNIPSFEVFISPDYRLTEGKIRFTEKLYRYGNLIENVYLEFKKGEVVVAKADKGEDVLKEMIATDEGSKRIGEFSLTDKRLSRISKFMAETLFDENVGQPNGNTHVALGKAYKDSYPGDPSKVTKEEWARLGYNESAIHTDIVATSNRKVIAYLPDGKEQVIYENGQFVI
jgi:aminopeptidase